MGEKIRIGALISGGGSNLQAVIDRCESGDVDGVLVFVGSDNPGASGLERAKRHGIPEFVVDYRKIIQRYQKDAESVRPPVDADVDALLGKARLFPPNTDPDRIRQFMATRLFAEAEMLEKIEAFSFDLLILAGFMRNLTPYFIDRVNTDAKLPRIMNIHPALLPAFPGTDGYGDTYRYGSRIGGCTVHFVDYGEDTGPIIGQKAFEIEDGDSPDRIKAKGLALEWELFPACIQLFAEGRLRTVRRTHTLKNGRTFSRTVVRCHPE